MGGESLKGREATRDEVETILFKLNEMGFFDLCSKYEVCGSYRRNEPVSSDIDIVVILNCHNEYLEWFRNFKGIKKLGGFCDSILIDGVQIDFFKASEDNFICQRLLWTGSSEFNKSIKGRYLRNNLFLSVNGVFFGKRKVTGITSEEQIFRLVGMKYVPPENRDFGRRMLKKIMKKVREKDENKEKACKKDN